MAFPSILYTKDTALTLQDFKQMDYYAVENYGLPIELMMENAGLQLANLIASFASPNQTIQIGVGNGNNGGGGMVAARRLAAWGYTVFIDPFTNITKELPSKQLKRAISFGAQLGAIEKPAVWVDAYMGFSQRLPLPQPLLDVLEQANSSKALRISLDIPTGFLGDLDELYFTSDKVLTLAYPKKILTNLPITTEQYVADLGIPASVYAHFNVEPLPFFEGNILEIKPK